MDFGHPGYAVSQRIRKRIEKVFGWVKASAGFRHTRHRGRKRVAWCFDLAAIALNLIRLSKLLAAATDQPRLRQPTATTAPRQTGIDPVLWTP